MANAQFALLKVIAKALGNALGGGIAGDLLVEILPEVAKDSWEWWSKEKDAKARREELEAIVRAEGEQLRQQVSVLVQEVAGNQSPQTQEAISGYLNQLPAAIRRSMRRPEDPTGTTIPQELAPRKSDDLLRLLPSRLPQFKQGDQPLPGVDRVLDSLLGVGGFGEVWKAHNPNLSSAQPVALKFCLDPIAARALQNETLMIDRVMKVGKHPGIVQLLNTYLNAKNPCLEYEYVEGGDLGGLILSWHALPTPPNPAEAAKVMLRLTEIVAIAHKADIVHRDLKPANILTVKGTDGATQFKIADFGIGGVATRRAIQESLGGSRARMQVSAVQGSYTPLYASPQQMKGEAADPRDDVYSLGVIWHQLLTGDLGMGSPSGAAWKRKLSEKGMTPSLLSLLESCFEQEAADRPADAGVLAKQLSGALQPDSEKQIEGEKVGKGAGVSQPIPAPKSKTQNSQPWLSYAIGVIALLLAGWLGIPYLRGGGNPTATPMLTSVAVISTNTPIAPLDTATPTAVATATPTVPTATATVPTATFTATEQPTETPTLTPTVTPTATPIPPTATATLLAGMPRNATAGQSWTEPFSKINFVHVPAGEFLMGSTPQQVKDAGELCKKYNPDCNVDWFTNELTQTTISTAAYWIGKTEITNAQFKRFIEDGGYSNDAYWTEAGVKWRNENKVTQPNCWENKDFNSGNQPVVCVSWYEALAYTEWLSQKTGLTVRLPNEAEWEKAARGTKGQTYPWGNDFDGTRLNYCDKRCNEVYTTMTWADVTVTDGYANAAPVGSFPSGASPYGALDMAGNVWEWNSTLWGKYLSKPDFNYPYDAKDGREDVSVGNSVYRVLRGGAWYNAPINARGAGRSRFGADYRFNDFGFRVVVSFSPGS